jgi:hypothetical protein
LRRQLVGELDGLAFDTEAAEGDVVGADLPGGRGAVAVSDFPGRAFEFLIGCRLFGVELLVPGAVGGFGAGAEEGGPELRHVVVLAGVWN